MKEYKNSLVDIEIPMGKKKISWLKEVLAKAEVGDIITLEANRPFQIAIKIRVKNDNNKNRKK